MYWYICLIFVKLYLSYFVWIDQQSLPDFKVYDIESDIFAVVYF